MQPVKLQTGAQRQACTVKDDVDIGTRQPKFRADLWCLQLDNLAHHENAALLWWQPVEARIKNGKELS